ENGSKNVYNLENIWYNPYSIYILYKRYRKARSPRRGVIITMGDTITSEEARSRFSEIISRAEYGHERIIVTKHGRKAVALIPMADLELLERIISKLEDIKDAQDANAALQEVAANGTIPWSKIKAELGL
ncbi:MAG: type II toxin-antitoxin system Phd/YefM family antitoxin, partial [candidate division Zixibacteria bacterium]|nr:type II toxin-antitoxin system Phd/YefM family antitoxin [candidate division Zixibacteria bacterium]